LRCGLQGKSGRAGETRGIGKKLNIKGDETNSKADIG